jgi:hypothetical protein
LTDPERPVGTSRDVVFGPEDDENPTRVACPDNPDHGSFDSEIGDCPICWEEVVEQGRAEEFAEHGRPEEPDPSEGPEDPDLDLDEPDYPDPGDDYPDPLDADPNDPDDDREVSS